MMSRASAASTFVLRLAGLPLATVLTVGFVALAAALVVGRSLGYVVREAARHQRALRVRQAASAALPVDWVQPATPAERLGYR